MKNFKSKCLAFFTRGTFKLPDALPTEPVVELPLTDVPGLRIENIFLFTREGMFYLVDSEGGKHAPSLVPDGDDASKLVFTRMRD
jgi:hypothetical protein